MAAMNSYLIRIKFTQSQYLPFHTKTEVIPDRDVDNMYHTPFSRSGNEASWLGASIYPSF
jgi:hypothetical protein